MWGLLYLQQFTDKLNMPVLGTGADGPTRALARLWGRPEECPGVVSVRVQRAVSAVAG